MEKQLKIYFTSDLHGYFYPTTYGDHTEQPMGLFKCASQFEKDGNTLIIDGGDMLQGSAFVNYCQSVLKSNLPVAQIMNTCGYDYVTLGNHDFNYGRDYLESYLEALKGQCVCQNVEDLSGRSLYPAQVKVLENGLKVGLVGIVTDYVNVWEKEEHLTGLKVTDPFEAAKKALESLKGQVDLTVCIYHGGFEKDLETGKTLSDTTENVAYKICEALDFDILLTGHQHMCVTGQDVAGTFVVQPTANGTVYHEVTAVQNEAGWQFEAALKKPMANGYHQALAKETDEIEAAVQKWLDEPVGHLSRPLKPEDKVKMALEGSPIADFLNEVQFYFSKAQVSAVGLANEIAGFNKEVMRRDIIATYPYPNTLVVYEITGEYLKAAMERSAEYFAVNEKEEIVVSDAFLQPKVEHYNYDFFKGVTYTLDVKAPIGERISNLCYEGKMILPTDLLTLCINNYRASGAGGYPMYTKCRLVKEINIEMVDLIMAYFEAHPQVNI